MCSPTVVMTTPVKVQSYSLPITSNQQQRQQQNEKMLDDDDDDELSVSSSSSPPPLSSSLIVPPSVKLSSSSLSSSSSHTNMTTTAPPPPPPTTTRTKTIKSVQFSTTLTVREYVICLSENTIPSTYGPPIGLGWKIQSEYTWPLPIDEYEYEHNQNHQCSDPPPGHDDDQNDDDDEDEEEINNNLLHPGRSNSRITSTRSSSIRRSLSQSQPSQLKMTPIERQQLLMSNGYSREDIQKATDRSNRERLKRLGSIRKLQRQQKQKQWRQDKQQAIMNVWTTIKNKRTALLFQKPLNV